MAKNLTAAAVLRLKPGKQRREIRDGGAPGLFLVIQRTGHMSWAMRFRRPNGKSAKLVLGPVDISGKEQGAGPVMGAPLTLAAARALAAEVHRQRQRNLDVAAHHTAEKRRQRAAREASAKHTFAAAARDFVEEYARKKQRRWPETARLLGLDPKKELALISGGLSHRWRDKPLAEIDGHDIFGLIEETRRSGAPGLERRGEGPTEARARAMLSALSKMFGWLVQRRRAEKNPCAGVHRPDAPKAHDRVLTNEEIVKFWSAASAVGEPFGHLLKVLLLTGCRLNEVAGMTRGELSEDGTTWNLPGSRTKNGRPHVVPLPPLARDILATVKRKESRAGLVFTTTGVTPVSGWSRVKHRLDKEMKVAPWRLHDLRRSCATGMAELGIPPHIIEAALNHVSGARAGVAGTYNRAAYAEEKREALLRWSQHVACIASGKPTNVVRLRKAK